MATTVDGDQEHEDEDAEMGARVLGGLLTEVPTASFSWFKAAEVAKCTLISCAILPTSRRVEEEALAMIWTGSGYGSVLSWAVCVGCTFTWGGEEDGLGLRHAVVGMSMMLSPGIRWWSDADASLQTKLMSSGKLVKRANFPLAKRMASSSCWTKVRLQCLLVSSSHFLKSEVEAPGGVDAGQLPVGLVGPSRPAGTSWPRPRGSIDRTLLRHGEKKTDAGLLVVAR